MRSLNVPFLLLSVALALSSCAPSRSTLPIEELVSRRVDPRVYRSLYPGDVIDVQFERTPEQNVTLPVRPDGTIKLPHTTTLMAWGRTPEELEVEIERQYSQELRDPVVTVVLQSVEGRTVHVGGEVEDPGTQVLSTPRTVLEAVIAAGGPRETAYLEQVLLIRTFGARERRVFELDLTRVISGFEIEHDIALRPSDVVYLPRSPIAEINVWVDQYIRRNLPFSVSVRPDLGVDR